MPATASMPSPTMMRSGAVMAWRRSLQLRVAASTALASALVVVVAGFVLSGQVRGGLLNAKKNAAIAQADEGRAAAERQLTAVGPTTNDFLRNSLYQLVSGLSSTGSNAGIFDVVIITKADAVQPVVSGHVDPGSVAPALRKIVQRSIRAYQYGPIRHGGGPTTTGLVVGEPIVSSAGTFQLYYLFSTQTEARTLSLVEHTVLLVGLLLVLMVVAIAVIVTRQVVAPVRRTAATAERLAAGHLEERLTVRGADDFATLASSFNDMAASLQRQIVQLEALSRVQQRFTSDVSHELRTPLTTIRMATDVLHSARSEFDPDLARAAELLQNELTRFESLLSDLLEISRHDARAATLDLEPTDLRSVVREVADSTHVLAARAVSDVVLRLPADPVVADVDRRRIARVLRNLVTNALEYGAGMPVEVTLSDNETAAAVTVRDHGIGLRAGEELLVFNRFWRADPSRTRRTGGTGLGLAISREDTNLHNGWLDAWGDYRNGAQFRLTVPLHAGRPIESSPLPVEPDDTADGSPGDLTAHARAEGPAGRTDLHRPGVGRPGPDDAQVHVGGRGRDPAERR